jgi:hypothetical protein
MKCFISLVVIRCWSPTPVAKVVTNNRHLVIRAVIREKRGSFDLYVGYRTEC